ncbi:Ig-like domain-containing protein, partial [[Eubacterium] cellulosolvens]
GLEGNGDEYLTIDGFKVTYSFPESYVDKQVLMSLLVFDGDGSDEDKIRINITRDYTPKLRQELPDVWLEEGETRYNVFDMDEYFEDPDEDSLFYSFGETHVNIQINYDHTVDISAPSNWNGVDTVTFRARDPMGAIAEDTILVFVQPINDPPIIEGLPEIFTVHHDWDYSLNLLPYISDEDNEMNELFLILADEHIRIDPLSHLKIIMNYPRSMLGMEVAVDLVVSDGRDTGSQSVTVKVTDNWPPEIQREMADVSFYEDEELVNAFNLNDYFTDKDSKTLFYTRGQEFVKIIINVDGSVDFTALDNWFGVEIVTFRATDETNAFVENVITVTVIPVNDPPVIKPIPTQKGQVNHLWKIGLKEFISDIDNDFSELEITVDSYIIDVMVSGDELLIYSDEPIVENVTIIVSDGMMTISKSLLIEIYEGESTPSGSNDNLLPNLWLLILVILILVSLSGYTAYRKYVGNYRIEEIFWINNNGILITHVSSTKSKHVADEYVVSGMLTAIVNFTQEAFTDTAQNKAAWGVKEIQMDEKNILVERGEHTFLATVFSGRSGKILYSKSGNVLRKVEGKYEKKLKSWDGNLNKYKGAKKIIGSMLPSETQEKSKVKK